MEIRKEYMPRVPLELKGKIVFSFNDRHRTCLKLHFEEFGLAEVSGRTFRLMT